jgi:hypothetical protein
MKKEIVIAAYNKSLDWIQNINSDIKITVYRKGEILPLGNNEIKISPNNGRCVHTFFNHIYSNYDNLSDYTFFVQDFPFDHWGNLLYILNSDVKEIGKNASLTIDGYYGYHNNTFRSAWHLQPSLQFENGNILSCYSNGHPQDHNPNINIDKYWDMLFNCAKPSFYEFMPGGHFCITKEHIHLRSRELYKKIVDLLIEDVAAPWIIERLECYIFHPKFKTKL